MQLDRVAYRYRRRDPWVLREVSLTLPPGRVVEVRGRNGAGKSTLLRLLAGLSRPRRGRVTGRPARVGYAPERFAARQPFTVARYLTHMARVAGLPDRAEVIAEWAERLRFADLLDVRLPELSKGSAQKVGLAQALLAGPDLLVLDEPFAGLDAPTRTGLPELLAGLAARGTTVVVSDHGDDLRELPDVRRWRVAGGTVVTTTGADRPDRAIIEVVVAADEADRVAAALRARGYDARVPRAPGEREPNR